MRALIQRREFAFLVVGGINLVIAIVLFAALLHTVGAYVHYMVVLALTYVLSISSAFYLQRRFVFKVRHQWITDFVRFCLVQSVGAGLNAVLLPLLVEVAHVPVLPAQVVALGLVALYSYFGHLFFSFRRTEPAD